jgi:hypothetical protein
VSTRPRNGTLSITVPTANATYSRYDLIVARFKDEEDSTATTGNAIASFELVQGTASASPVAPAVPANSLLLAQITVGANVTSITSGNIADKRIYTAALGGRGWRAMKTHLDLRPVHHRKEERIRAHVLLCWLALLLIRVAEIAIPTCTWRRIREQLQTLHVGVFTGNAGGALQRTELTTTQSDILRALAAAPPARFLELTTGE